MDNSSSRFTEQAELQNNKQTDQFLGRALVRLQVRLESVEIKVMSLSKIVRLLQQYSEKKDQQYEKETQNHQQIDQKLVKIDVLQTQMTQAASRCDEMASLFQSQTHKMEQNFKSMLEKQVGLRDAEERLNYQMEELDRKINKIETTMLQQIREGCRNNEDIKSKPSAADHYLIEEISFKINQLEAQFNAQTIRLKTKIDKIHQKLKKQHTKETDDYGLLQERKKSSKMKFVVKQKESSPLKRVRSK